MKCDIDYFITFDSYRVGELQAKDVIARQPKGNYMLIKGAPDNNNARLISKAYQDVLGESIARGDITVVMDQFCNGWDPSVALRHSENALSIVQNDIQGCVVSNDGMAGAVVQALDAQGLAGKVPVTGQDADLSACQRIVEGTQTMTAYKPLAKVNQAACQLMVAVAMGKDAASAIDPELGTWQKYDNEFKMVDAFLVDVVPITKENIDEIIIKRDNFHSKEDVYRNLPRDQWPD